MSSRRRGRSGTKETPSRTLVKEFLACQHLLSDEEILEFISGGEQQDGDNDESNNINQRVTEAWIQHNHESCDEHFHLRQAFYRRKTEIRKLAANLRDGLGGARIDEDGRLVPVTEPPQPPRADLPPVGGDANNANNNLQFNQQQMENQEELLMAQKLREAEFTVEHAVRELRRKKVPEEDFEVLLLDHRGRPRVAPQPGFAAQNNNNDNEEDDERTFLMHPGLQRLAFGCFTMVALIIVITLKVLPISSIINMDEAVDKTFDPLLNQVLVARNWEDHVRECSGGLVNRSASHYNPNLFHRIQQSLLYGNTTTDCSDGVLHIPSKRVLYSEIEVGQWRVPGVNVSWFMPCSGRTFERDVKETSSEECPSSLESKDDFEKCAEDRSQNRCFRGIHDDFVGRMEIDAALKMGDFLIRNGGDHFDIHYDSRYLQTIPSIIKKVTCLLETTYLKQREHSQKATSYGECLKSNSATTGNLRPVAFRVLTTGPMDGHNVKLKQGKGDKMIMYLTHSTALNESNYLSWVLKNRKHNDKARYQSYYRPWFYRLQPKRETCDLKFDLQTDSRFCIQTSLYLTNGAGEDYWGGTDLFVDDHPSNFENPSRRIARGTSIDGTEGRLVVSSGGFENLQCRLPTRSGFRSVLQIWWEC